MNVLIPFSAELGHCMFILTKIEVVFVLDGRILWYEYIDFDLYRLDFACTAKVLFWLKELETKL